MGESAGLDRLVQIGVGMVETAVFGGGCFWCLDALFRMLSGVLETTCGYAGGRTPDPDYEAVCRGDTGHAEVLRVTFDPAVIDYQSLLEMFFAAHDPTTPNRQGNDVGTQYRSIICYQSAAQRATASALIEALGRDGRWPATIVTELRGAEPFYAAEDYHQDYFAKHPEQGYCAVVIAPKVAHFRQDFAARLRP